MRTRAVVPGAVLAGALTAAALLALLLGLAIRGDGPLPLGLGDSGGSAQLSVGEGTAPAGNGGRQAAPIALPLVAPRGGVAAPAAGVAASRGATAPRATTRGERVATRPTLRTPSRRTPSVAPAPTAAPPATGTTTTTTSRPVATSTPGPVALKVRGRGKKESAKTTVPKSRVRPGKPAVPVATPGQEPAPGPGPREGDAPPVEKHRVDPPGQVKKGVGADDGVLKRVPKSPKP
jgi:hypothetical protein